MSTTVSARIEDEELERALEAAETKSEDLRQALREYYGLKTDHGLGETLGKVYEALLVLTDGGGRVDLTIAKKAVPQFATVFDQVSVVDGAFRPLEARGFIKPIQRIESVDLYVRPQHDVELQEPVERDLEDYEDVGDHLTDEERDRAILEGEYEVEGEIA